MAGSGWPSSARSSARPGSSSTRSRRSTTWAPALLRALHVQGWAIADYPERLGRWPATAGFAFFVWLELVVVAGPSTLFIVLVGYTALTLAMMAQFGRDEWRSHGETFTVWFRTLGRLAYWRLVDEDGRVARRSFGSGLLEPGWSRADVTLVALGRVVDHLRRAVADAAVLRPVRGARHRREDAAALRVARHRRGARLRRRHHGRPRRDRRRPAADRPGLPHRPLPDLSADRRPAHPHRHLRPVPEGLEPVRHRLPHAERRVAAAGPRLDRPARGGRRRPHAGRLGRPRRGGGRRTGRDLRERPCAAVRSRSRS